MVIKSFVCQLNSNSKDRKRARYWNKKMLLNSDHYKNENQEQKMLISYRVVAND